MVSVRIGCLQYPFPVSAMLIEVRDLSLVALNAASEEHADEPQSRPLFLTWKISKTDTNQWWLTQI